jgi:hypothetical protein
MKVVACRYHAQCEDDNSSCPNVKAGLAAKKVRNGAKNKSAQNKTNNSQCEKVRGVMSLKHNL